MSRVAESRELTDQQKAFALEFVRNGGRGADAARSAGFSERSAGKYAFQLLEKPHVQKAIQSEQRRMLSDLASIALGQAAAMLTDPKTPAGARVELIRTVLDRAGLGAPKAGDDEGNEERPLREMSLARLEALAVRAIFRPAEEGTAAAAPVDAVVERLEPPIAQPATDEVKQG